MKYKFVSHTLPVSGGKYQFSLDTNTWLYIHRLLEIKFNILLFISRCFWGGEDEKCKSDGFCFKRAKP